MQIYFSTCCYLICGDFMMSLIVQETLIKINNYFSTYYKTRNQLFLNYHVSSTIE